MNSWRSRIADVAGASMAALAPLLFMFRVCVPNQPWSRTITNDFASFYLYKLWLLDALSRWTIPFWSPSEACGFPFYSSPFTQTFYPLNIPLALFYKGMGGYSYSDHQVFTILGMAVFAAGLYAWLRSLGIALHHALLGAVVAATSCKMTETMRFYVATHTIAWLPFALWGCTLALHRRTRTAGATILCASVVMMATAGYPYFLYYAAFVLGAYVLALYVPWSRTALHAADTSVSAPADTPGIEPPCDSRRAFLLSVFASAGVAMLLCLPYLLKMRSLLLQTVNRSGSNYAFSTKNSLTLADTVGSLVFPPASCMEGWYYFGVGVLLLLIIFLAGTVFSGGPPRDRRLWLMAGIYFLVVTLVTYGRHSWLFWILWHMLPGFSSLREWGRFNIVLVPALALLVARAYEWLARACDGHCLPAGKTAWFVLLAGTVAVLATQALCMQNNVLDAYWHRYFLHSVPDGLDTTCFLWSTIAGALAVAAMLAVPRMFTGHASCALHLLMAVLLAINTWDVGRVGCVQWTMPSSPRTDRCVLGTDNLMVASLSSPRTCNQETAVPIDQTFYAHVTPDWYFNRYVAFLKMDAAASPARTAAEPSRAFRMIVGMANGNRFFLSRSLDYRSFGRFLDDAIQHATRADFGVTLQHYTGDDFCATVYNSHAGYFSFIDNWDSDWRATVNGRPVDIQLLFGTFKSVALTPGTNTVMFSYRPRFW